MKVFKTTVTLTFYTAVDQVIDAWGPRQKDIERNPSLVNESPLGVINNHLRGMRDINEGAWEPHASDPTFESKIELVEMPDEEIQNTREYFMLNDGVVISEKRPDDKFISGVVDRLEEKE